MNTDSGPVLDHLLVSNYGYAVMKIILKWLSEKICHYTFVVDMLVLIFPINVISWAFMASF